MRTVLDYLNSDRPGAAYAFGLTIIGGTFAGIVALSGAMLTVIEALRAI